MGSNDATLASTTSAVTIGRKEQSHAERRQQKRAGGQDRPDHDDTAEPIRIERWQLCDVPGLDHLETRACEKLEMSEHRQPDGHKTKPLGRKCAGKIHRDQESDSPAGDVACKDCENISRRPLHVCGMPRCVRRAISLAARGYFLMMRARAVSAGSGEEASKASRRACCMCSTFP